MKSTLVGITFRSLQRGCLCLSEVLIYRVHPCIVHIINVLQVHSSKESVPRPYSIYFCHWLANKLIKLAWLWYTLLYKPHSNSDFVLFNFSCTYLHSLTPCTGYLLNISSYWFWVEYSTSFHPMDGMMWNIPHHSVHWEAEPMNTTECYVWNSIACKLLFL